MYKRQVFNTVLSEAQVSLNSAAVSARYNEEIANYESQARMLGGSLSSLAQQYGTDEGGFKEMVMASVRAQLEEEVVIDTIAQQEGLTLTDEDRQGYAENNGSDVDTLVGIYGQETFDQMVERSKVLKFLADNAVEEQLPEETEAAETETEETAAETTEAAQ